MSHSLVRSLLVALAVLLICGVGAAEEKEITFCSDRIRDLTLKVDDPSYETWLLLKGSILNVDNEYGEIKKNGISFRKMGFPHELKAYVASDFSVAFLENRNLKRIKLHPSNCKMDQLNNLIDYDTKGPFSKLQRYGNELPSDDPYLDPWTYVVDFIDEYGFYED